MKDVYTCMPNAESKCAVIVGSSYSQIFSEWLVLEKKMGGLRSGTESLEKSEFQQLIIDCRSSKLTPLNE